MTAASAAMGAASPLYARIAGHLRAGIRAGTLPRGTVLLEGPLASLFGSGRSPVRQALSRLEDEGLVGRFAGRGLIVGPGAQPVRCPVTPDMVALEPRAEPGPKVAAWERDYYAFERAIILRSVFGRFRVNEIALARHFGVGRTVAHDLVMQAGRAGLVAEGERSHRWVVPLDETRCRDLYALRILLEPAALADAASRLPPDALHRAERSLADAIRRFPALGVAELDALEHDLHVTLLGFCANAEILHALARVRPLLVTGKHIQHAMSPRPQVDRFMDEHLAVVLALKAGDVPAAQAALVAHLRRAGDKAAETLHAFRAGARMEPVAFLLP